LRLTFDISSVSAAKLYQSSIKEHVFIRIKEQT
jgi:hypothetical protein